MQLFISGFCEKEALAHGYAQDGQNQATWLEPEVFIQRVKQAESFGHQQHWIWLYRAPWSLLISDTGEIPEGIDEQHLAWVTWQRSLLTLRHSISTTILLVNRDTTSAQELNSALNLGPPTVKSPPKPINQKLNVALSKLFEWLAPPSWDVLESLEAVALAPSGHLMFRNNIAPPEQRTLIELMTLLHAGKSMPQLINKVTEQSETIAKITEENKSIREENELLLLQLRQAQEDGKSILQLTNKVAEQSETIAKITEENKSIREENELLFLQLCQTQEDLQKYYQKSQTFRTSLKSTQETMNRARVLISRLAPQQ